MTLTFWNNNNLSMQTHGRESVVKTVGDLRLWSYLWKIKHP